VKNIPAGLNTIAHINNHFARFGTLVNVQVSSDNSCHLTSFLPRQLISARPEVYLQAGNGIALKFSGEK
jgi:hypothetical protein